MDEMAPHLEGFVMVILAMMLAMSAILALGAAWAGWRRVRQGRLRRALAWQAGLGAGVLATGGMGLWAQTPLWDNPWLWLCALVAAPALGGHLMGVVAGMIAPRAD